MREGENISFFFLSHGPGQGVWKFLLIYLPIYISPPNKKAPRSAQDIFFSHFSAAAPQLSLINLPFSPSLSFISFTPCFSYYSHVLHLLSVQTFIPPLIVSSSIFISTAFIFSSVPWIGKEDPTADLATIPFSGFVGTPPSLIFALPTANSPW